MPDVLGDEMDGEAHIRFLLGNVKAQADANDKLREACEDGLQLSGGWREAIASMEVFGDPVRLKNMTAALNQLDEWRKQVRRALA